MPQIHDRQLAAIDRPINANLSPVEIDDPDKSGDRLIVTRRLDVLSRMHARHQIDDACYEAGKRYQSISQAAQVGSVKGADFTREVVDGNPPRDFFTTRRLKAVATLSAVDHNLKQEHGTTGLSVTRAVLLDGCSLTQVAAIMGYSTNQSGPDVRSLAWLLARCLEQIAVELGHLRA